MTKTTIFLSFLLLLFGHANSESQLNDKEQIVLLKLKQHWQNPPSLSHWQNPLSLSHLKSLNSSHHCNWPEITCTNGLVTQLLLQNKNITQTVPPFICDLENLTVIDLSHNFISQEFPKALYNCSKLEELDLSQNYFNGTIPVDIHRLSHLRHLNLGANSFYGNIPSSIGKLTELRTLQLFQCAFNGSFPREIGNLFKLESLWLAYNVNMTAAELPSSFTKLKKLKYLWITASNLNGEIPDTIGEMEALEHLDLSINNLTGKIPSSLFMPKKLSIVYLYRNRLFGEIPRVVEALNIDVIDLSDNKLTGSIPDDFGRLRNMTGLSLFFNQLSGKIPDSIGRLPSLAVLKVFSNNLSGTLPPDFGRYSMLVEFQVADNELEGKLPEHLCVNGQLVGVVAFNNNLTGELPKSLGNCSGLKIVTVYNNRLSGDIPSGLWTSLNLSVLILSDNSFTGELPQRVARNLSRLEINNNNFSGTIPAGVSSWRNLVVFEASNNLFTGTIPREVTSLPYLTTLFLDQNQLSGSLPPDIISWKTLNTLNLRRNKISGPIPEKLGKLAGLTELDLSENQLSGQIPLQLGLLKLTLLNLSSNHLTGRIPTQFENDAYALSFLNNLALCANKPSLNINSCNNSDHPKSSKVPSKYLPLIICFVAAALLSLVVAMISIYRKGKHGLDSTWKFTIFQRVNFRESDILSGLTEINVIGRGGSGKVYRVVVNDSNNFVAVKRIWNNRKPEQKLEKEFHAEVKILGSIRHSNIVKLLCCMSNENSKLLVYEYAENRSLDQWLHRKSRASSTSSLVQHVVLDWPKRLQIAVGAAQGLYYMHHGCSPPIVHRDVKSSNILLDSEFNAKIADFGLAKMFNQGKLSSASVVAGSFGYIAPECARTTRVNEKIDVYSFGVILLELTTGREARDGDEHTSLAEWAWRYIKDDIPIVDALDEEIKEPSYLEEMSSVFNLGIYCTSTKPSKRPSMKEVVKILLKCNQPLVYGEKIAASLYDASPPLKNSKRKSASENDEEILASIV
nr:receptor-like protein kinase HSL1 [Quercus suber]POE46778.1 receptor-like protein kinase hsl1 [Quercus suber]